MKMPVSTYVENALNSHGMDSAWTAEDVVSIRQQTEQLAERAYSGDAGAAADLHHLAYRVLLRQYEQPASPDLIETANPILSTFLWVFGTEWDRHDNEKHEVLLSAIPDDPAAYPSWIEAAVQEHPSNVHHPLFDFLEKEATYGQLREYVVQDSPFDPYFADVLAALLPGVYGEPKMEIAHNFWDEMGCGTEERVHRNLRLDLTRELEVPVDVNRGDLKSFLLEEIELANSYFLAASTRFRALQLVGMLLATESMVPGRLDKQITGWRRVGLGDEHMGYLLEHTVVDIEHAEDWMSHVVVPIVQRRPEAMRGITLGVARRLDIAGRLCDSMLEHLQTSVSGTAVAA